MKTITIEILEDLPHAVGASDGDAPRLAGLTGAGRTDRSCEGVSDNYQQGARSRFSGQGARS